MGTADDGALLGAILILCGAAVAVVGAYRFRRTAQQIETDSYRPSVGAHLVFAAIIAIAALAVAAVTILDPA